MLQLSAHPSPDAAASRQTSPFRARALPEVQLVVSQLVDSLASTAVERDHCGGSPLAERQAIRDSGLLALTIPPALGGLGGRWSHCLDVVRQLAQADGSVAHLFAFHHLMLATVCLYGAQSQWSDWLARTAAHDWFWGNALNPRDTRTRIEPIPGGWQLCGPKSFCSGATDSQMMVVSGWQEGQLRVAAIPSSRSGIRIQPDWDNMGQRQTDSGSVFFDRVRLHPQDLLVDPGPLSTPRSTLRSLLSQLILVHIYLGISEGAFAAARQFVLHEGHAGEDAFMAAHCGDFWADLHAARLLAGHAADRFDHAWQLGDALGEAERGELAVAVAAAKVISTRSGLDICSRIFEVTGARSTHAGLGLDRFWRNLRTHTLHDPLDTKRVELGRWALHGVHPEPGFYS